MADTIVLYPKNTTLVGKASPVQDHPSDPYDGGLGTYATMSNCATDSQGAAPITSPAPR